jgi:predicted NUDIX family phosphoesterase
MEFVYVVPRGKLFPDCYPQGLVPFGDASARTRFEETIREQGFFVEREYAERTPELKQVIPYTVFRVGGDVLLMRRLRSGGESRLHDKLSIGVGGHINPGDGTATGGTDPVEDGTRREVEEELDVRGTYELRRVGFLNDDSNQVGAVHVGVVQIAEVRGTVEIRERDVLEGSLASPDELRKRLRAGENFETWSSILIDRFVELVPNPEPVSA